MKKTNLVWRLPSKLTLEDIEKMLALKIITPEEAKELTFNSADDNEKVKALEEQVKFLKELVDKLSSQPTTQVWRYINTYTPHYGWNVATSLGATYTTLASANSAAIGVSIGAASSSVSIGQGNQIK